MSDQTVFLALFLDAPLQSWGYGSRFDYRTTLSFPTRSGIMGMICAAMGIDRNDAGSLRQFDATGMKSFTFSQNGRLVDFHTVGGGFDPKSERRHMVRRANNATPETVVTHREYLTHTRFGVILDGPETLIRRIAGALRHPRWGIWLGRKSCVPASPICQGVFADEQGALDRLKQVAGTEEIRRVVSESTNFDGGVDTLMDVPLDFAKRRFAPRRISVENLQEKFRAHI